MKTILGEEFKYVVSTVKLRIPVIIRSSNPKKSLAIFRRNYYQGTKDEVEVKIIIKIDKVHRNIDDPIDLRRLMKHV